MRTPLASRLALFHIVNAVYPMAVTGLAPEYESFNESLLTMMRDPAYRGRLNSARYVQLRRALAEDEKRVGRASMGAQFWMNQRVKQITGTIRDQWPLLTVEMRSAMRPALREFFQTIRKAMNDHIWSGVENL